MGEPAPRRTVDGGLSQFATDRHRVRRVRRSTGGWLSEERALRRRTRRPAVRFHHEGQVHRHSPPRLGPDGKSARTAVAGRSRIPVDDRETVHGESGVARRGLKDRRDHIHHAIDVVLVAFCREEGQILSNLAHTAKRQEETHAEGGYWLSREAVDPPAPWKTIDEFRRCVVDAASELVISHRAVKRRLIGALHKATLYGPVANDVSLNEKHRTENPETLFTNRIFADALKPNHLRVPDGWDAKSAELDDTTLTKTQRRAIRKELNEMPDPSPGKSGIVRDRDQLRRCLRTNGVDPDSFDAKAIQTLVENEQLTMVSGVPIKRVILLLTLTAPVRIDRRHWDEAQQKAVPADDQATRRREQCVYDSQNNHHIEIRDDEKTGRWTGEVGLRLKT